MPRWVRWSLTWTTSISSWLQRKRGSWGMMSWLMCTRSLIAVPLLLPSSTWAPLPVMWETTRWGKNIITPLSVPINWTQWKCCWMQNPSKKKHVVLKSVYYFKMVLLKCVYALSVGSDNAAWWIWHSATQGLTFWYFPAYDNWCLLRFLVPFKYKIKNYQCTVFNYFDK